VHSAGRSVARHPRLVVTLSLTYTTPSGFASLVRARNSASIHGR
jgi:hypothetical protein